MFSADVMVRSNEGDDALMSQSVVSVYQQRGRKSVVRNRKQPDIIYTPHAAYECNCILSKIARNWCDIIVLVDGTADDIRPARKRLSFEETNMCSNVDAPSM